MAGPVPKGNLQVTKEKFAKPISKVNTVGYFVSFYVRICIMGTAFAKHDIYSQVLQYCLIKR